MAKLIFRIMIVLSFFSVLLLSSCQLLFGPKPIVTEDSSWNYSTHSLDIKNQTSNDIVISLKISKALIYNNKDRSDISQYTHGSDTQSKPEGTKIISISANETYSLSYEYRSGKKFFDDVLQSFSQLYFYKEKTEAKPYIKYQYQTSDTEKHVWRKQDSDTKINLYDKSPDRPFYLISKAHNIDYRDTPTIIITSVPEAPKS